MRMRRTWIRCIIGLAVLSAGLHGNRGGAAEVNPENVLKEYVQQPDASYGWKVRRRGELLGSEFAELILTSQTWRDVAWKHQLVLFKPPQLADDSKQALLFITGGSWRDELEGPADGERLPTEALVFARLAQQLRSVVAVLMHVPHQPLFGGKHEDEIIALTFDEFLKTGDPSWPLLLPMVKSAVRGMDACTEFARQEWQCQIENFTVTGASKRGWTTWLTGAVEPRATAIAPMVIDVLNMARQMEHQREVWGKVSEEISDYSQRGLTDKLEDDRSIALRTIVDPYSYRHILQQPKLLLIGTNDRYWPIDALNLYWNDLSGPKYVVYIPNNGHSLKDLPRITGALHAVHEHAARGYPLPKLDWRFAQTAEGLVLEVEADQPVQLAQAWLASSADQDFRDEQWTSQSMVSNGNGSWRFQLGSTSERHAAVFGELMFECGNVPYYLSTNVHVLDWQAAEKPGG